MSPPCPTKSRVDVGKRSEEEEMAKLPDKSVDLFICDLPYVDIKGKGETHCSWNQGAIDLNKFWNEFKRIGLYEKP